METLQDHLKLASDYIQSRINSVDNKASILIAIQAGLFAIVMRDVRAEIALRRVILVKDSICCKCRFRVIRS